MNRTLTSMSAAQHEAIRSLLVAEAAAGSQRPARRRRLLVTAAAMTLGLTVVAALITGDPAAPPGYAAWTAVPATAGGPAADPRTLQWASACSDLKMGSYGVPGVDPHVRNTRRPVLIDRRGSYTYCVDVSPGHGTTKDPLIGMSGVVGKDGTNNGWGIISPRPFTPPTGRDLVVLGGDLVTPPSSARPTGTSGPAAYQLYGMAGSAVTGVDIVLRNGLRITATVEGGLWGGWWPTTEGDPTGSRLMIHTGSTSRTVPSTALSFRKGQQGLPA